MLSLGNVTISRVKHWAADWQQIVSQFSVHTQWDYQIITQHYAWNIDNYDVLVDYDTVCYVIMHKVLI